MQQLPGYVAPAEQRYKPQVAQPVDKRNETAKHVSNQLLMRTIKDRSWGEARNIVYNDAAYARIYDPEGYLPLHLVVQLGGPPELVVLLLTAYPECIQIRDPDGSLALHLSAYHHKGRLWVHISELSTILFAAYPEAIRMADANGDLTLHIALRHRAPDELIKFLLLEYPESARLKDQFGNLPLHLAVQFQASYSVVAYILSLHPEALKIGNARSSLPLHKAAQFNIPMDILLLILDADPTAACAKDDRGNLPLHLCFLFCAGPPSEERLQHLLQRNPLALGAVNVDGCAPFAMMNRPQDHYVDDYR